MDEIEAKQNLLLGEMEHLSASFLQNEASGEARLNTYLALVAVAGALVTLVSQQASALEVGLTVVVGSVVVFPLWSGHHLATPRSQRRNRSPPRRPGDHSTGAAGDRNRR